MDDKDLEKALGELANLPDIYVMLRGKPVSIADIATAVFEWIASLREEVVNQMNRADSAEDELSEARSRVEELESEAV